VNIIQIVGFALTCALLLVLVRRGSAPLGLLLAVGASGVILTAVVSHLPPILDALNELADRAGVQMLYIRTIFQVIAVAYIVDIGAQLCSDVGEGALAKNIQLAGKVIILVMAVPIIIAVADVIIDLLEQVGGGL